MLEVDADTLSSLVGMTVYDIQPEHATAGGAHSRVYACRSEIGDLALRMCKGQQGYYTHYFPQMLNSEDWIDQRWAIEKARSAGVPAPEIVWSDRKLRLVLMRRIPGVPIHSDYESWNRCPYNEEEFGAILARLHAAKPSGYGPVDDYGRTLFSAWQGFLAEAAASALSTCIARRSIGPVLVRQLEERWLPKLGRASMERPSLLHMESLGFANLMYEPEKRAITGLLDYEDCIGGDPLFEICWMKYYFEYDSKDQPYFNFLQFAAGYGALEFDSERLSLYSPFPLLDKLRWIEPEGGRAREHVCRLEEYVSRC